MQIELSVQLLSILVFAPRDKGKFWVHHVVRTVYRMVATMVTIDWAVPFIIALMSLLSGRKYAVTINQNQLLPKFT